MSEIAVVLYNIFFLGGGGEAPMRLDPINRVGEPPFSYQDLTTTTTPTHQDQESSGSEGAVATKSKLS